MSCYQLRRLARKTAIVVLGLVAYGVPLWLQWQLIEAVRGLTR